MEEKLAAWVVEAKESGMSLAEASDMLGILWE
jgi:hypothetical protein